MNHPHLDQAREYAQWMIDNTPRHHQSKARAAAEVIQSLPDHWIDAEKVREVIEEARLLICDGESEIILNDLAALLPSPQPRTLADMFPKEREACQWMQAQTWHEVGIIVWMDELTEIAQLITRANGMLERKFKDVTPLPDLPRLEWPAQAPDDVAFATGGALTTQDVVDECRAVRKERATMEPTLPRPEDVPAGEPWLILHNGHEWVGARDSRDGANYPWALARLDGLTVDSAEDSEIDTLVSRLVPEVGA